MNKGKNGRQNLINRAARIEGQLRGIRRMIEEKRECVNIIAQISAAREAMAMLGVELLKDDFACKRKKDKKIDEKYLKTLFKIK